MKASSGFMTKDRCTMPFSRSGLQTKHNVTAEDSDHCRMTPDSRFEVPIVVGWQCFVLVLLCGCDCAIVLLCGGVSDVVLVVLC